MSFTSERQTSICEGAEARLRTNLSCSVKSFFINAVISAAAASPMAGRSGKIFTSPFHARTAGISPILAAEGLPFCLKNLFIRQRWTIVIFPVSHWAANL